MDRSWPKILGFGGTDPYKEMDKVIRPKINQIFKNEGYMSKLQDIMRKTYKVFQGENIDQEENQQQQHTQ